MARWIRSVAKLALVLLMAADIILCVVMRQSPKLPSRTMNPRLHDLVPETERQRTEAIQPFSSNEPGGKTFLMSDNDGAFSDHTRKAFSQKNWNFEMDQGKEYSASSDGKNDVTRVSPARRHGLTDVTTDAHGSPGWSEKLSIHSPGLQTMVMEPYRESPIFATRDSDEVGLRRSTVWSGCPPRCFCNGTADGEITLVDCTGIALTAYPLLPDTAVTVILRDNLISNLTQECIGQTPNLNTLDLSKNNISELPHSAFSPLRNLALLIMSENNISEMKSTPFHALTNLVTLDLSSNKQMQLQPGNFYGLANLKQLKLSNCGLKKLVNDTFIGLDSLQVLDLSSNELTYTDGTYEDGCFSDLTTLEQLFIRQNNRIEDLYFSLKDSKARQHDKKNKGGPGFPPSPEDFKYQPSDTNIWNDSARSTHDIGLGVVKQSTPTSTGASANHPLRSHYSQSHSLKDVYEENFNDSSAMALNDRNMGVVYDYPSVALSNLRNLRLLHLDSVPDAVFGPGFQFLNKLNTLLFSDDSGFFGNVKPSLFDHLNSTTSPLTIAMGGCGIDSIPPELFRPVPNIVSLHLDNNYNLMLDGVYNATVGLANSNLTELIVNSIVPSMEHVFYLSRKIFYNLISTPLRRLKLSKNRIYAIDPLLFMCLPPLLEELDLSDNYLISAGSVPFLVCMKNLKMLDISRQVNFHVSSNDTFNSWAENSSLGGSWYHENTYPKAVSDEYTCPDYLNFPFHVAHSNPFRCHCPKPKLDSMSPYHDTQMKRIPENVKLYSPSHLPNITVALRGLHADNNNMPYQQEMQSETNTAVFPYHSFEESEPSPSDGKENHGFQHKKVLKRLKRNRKAIRASSNAPTIPFPPKLEVLKANKMHLPYGIPELTIGSPNSLKHLEYSFNSAFCWAGPLLNLPHLQYLDLSHNLCRLVNLRFFYGLTAVTTLLINHNSLGHPLSLDEEGQFFSYLTNLENLEMRSNLISSLPAGILSKNTNLKHIDMSQNFMATFEVDLSNASYLLLLNLSSNVLPGLSDTSIEQLRHTRHNQKSSTSLSIDFRGQVLSCSCQYLEFLHFLCSEPEAFVSPRELNCSMPRSWHRHRSKQFPHFCADLPLIQLGCRSQDVFLAMVVLTVVFASTLILLAAAHHYRWRLQYLFYVGQPRNRLPSVDVYLTYDEEDIRIRTLVLAQILPRLEREGLRVTVGERDFSGGDEAREITRAVVDSKKVMVLLSEDIFDQSLREFEVNMAILYEMKNRCRLLLPVFIEQLEDNFPRNSPEIHSFLDSQWERCFYLADTETFWEGLLTAIRQQ
ncbi:uncharacterized protein LOC101858957 [Aplysia californica]|uniref:Uncharacterized protein LOC101858957 n=1 Tax=Aplysia californica TaxID=6500 RepID=A0ABM1A6J7_APLCA|nr:uncharacterized protein LOC101858957 [Aplysia californica]